jgi:MAF protein
MSVPFVLASGSPRRQDILRGLGLTFTVMKPDIDETQRPDEDAIAYVRRLSAEKASAVCARLTSPAVVLAADTTVALDGEVLGKPASSDEARIMLRRLRNRAHHVHTGVTLGQRLADGTAVLQTDHATTTVVMRDYTDAEMDAYIASGDPFDKAGAYAIQHEGFHPVARLEGSQTNVIGLPVETLETLLATLSR